MKRSKPVMYEVTLRRDVQQVLRVRVDAFSPQEAIAVAESAAEDAPWSIEDFIGAHRPKVQIHRGVPIKGRTVSKADRADKRRLGDKSHALVAARPKRSKS